MSLIICNNLFGRFFEIFISRKRWKNTRDFIVARFVPWKDLPKWKINLRLAIFFNRIPRRKLCDSQGLILRTRQSRLLLNDLLAWSRSVAFARHRDIPLSLISVEYSRVRASKIESVIVLELSSPFLSPLPSPPPTILRGWPALTSVPRDPSVYINLPVKLTCSRSRGKAGSESTSSSSFFSPSSFCSFVTFEKVWSSPDLSTLFSLSFSRSTNRSIHLRRICNREPISRDRF